jgi:hypothetical protein
MGAKMIVSTWLTVGGKHEFIETVMTLLATARRRAVSFTANWPTAFAQDGAGTTGLESV